MSLKDITITASINSIPTQSYGQKTYIASTDEQSFPIETIDGGSGGSMPNLFGQTSSIDLFVNITQSWPGSINTPVGLVSFTHDDQSEFINGEFSGSVLTVTTQSLNPECWPLLFGSQPNISYGLIPYKSEYNDGVLQDGGPFSIFIDGYTSPDPGYFLIHSKINWISDIDTYYLNINYLKVAKIDQEGNDNTLSLQELKNIRWTDSNPDIGEIILTVKNITEYPGYYLYEVTSKTWEKYLTSPSLSSINILNYALSASSNITNISAASNYYIPYNTWTTGSSTVDFGGIYYRLNESTPFYLYYTASIRIGNATASPITLNYGIYSTPDFISYNTIKVTSSLSLVPTDVKTFTLTGSFLATEKPYFYWTEISNLTGNIQVSNIKWIVTQSFAPQSAISSIVVDPYLISTFANSDCDVLMNNVEINEYDKQFMKVNYDSGQLIPTNQQQIISGTAEPAPVKAYNYRILSQTLPRYDGVRTESPNFNLPASNQFGQVPNAEQTNTYFLYFESMEGTSPLIKNKTSVKGKYLIREDGTTFDLNTDDVTYSNVIYSFERSKKAYASLFNNQSSTLTVTQSIFKSGQYYTPILYNLSASLYDSASFSQTIDFINIAGTSIAGIPNFDLLVTSYENYPTYPYADTYKRGLCYSGYGATPNTGWYSLGVPPGPFQITTGTIVNPFYYGRGNRAYTDSLGGWVDGTPTLDSLNHAYYKFNTQPLSLVDIEIKISYSYIPFFTPTYLLLETTLWSSGSNGIYPAAPAQTNTVTYTGAGISDYYLKVPNYQAYDQEALYVTVEIKNPSQLLGQNGIQGASLNVTDILTINPIKSLSPANYGQSTFKITTKNYAPPTPSYPFWFTGSANDTILTSSVDLGSALQGTFQQIDIPNSGMPTIEYPAVIKLGDEIRFEYDEDNVFIVKDAYPSGSNFILEVDHPIPSVSTININHFTIRRLEKDLTHTVILDTKLNKSITTGFLFPEYPSDQIKKNLPQIVSDLHSKNII